MTDLSKIAMEMKQALLVLSDKRTQENIDKVEKILDRMSDEDFETIQKTILENSTEVEILDIYAILKFVMVGIETGEIKVR